MEKFVEQRENVVPCQMFLRNKQRGGQCKITIKEIKRIRKLVDNFGMKFYVHAPYIINLCNPCTKKEIHQVMNGY